MSALPEKSVIDRDQMDRPSVAISRLKDYLAAPIGWTSEARLGLICLWLVQEVERLTGELNELADFVLEDQRFGIAGDENEHSHPGVDGGLFQRSSRPAAFADHDDWL